MPALLPVSFTLKLAAFCLLVGVVLGVWLGVTAVGSLNSHQPSPPPATQVANVPPEHPE